jgi:hypothetical protein
MATNNHWDSAGLNGFGVHASAFDLDMLTFIVSDGVCPQTFDDLNKLVASAPSIFEAVAASLDFFLAPSHANAKIDSTLAEPV